MKRLYRATLNTIRGFAHAIRSEQAFRQEAAALLLGLPIGLFVAPSAAWYVAMIGSCSTAPVKYSFGARRVGRDPASNTFMTASAGWCAQNVDLSFK